MLFDDIYRTLASPSTGSFREKGSKFLAFAFPVSDETGVKEILGSLRKKYFDATHHCYAYQLGFDKSAQRMNDDGEPSGTAGRPIFGQIQSFDLTNVLIVIIRYYGGTKLGVSGLIHAYRTAAKEALEAAEIREAIVRDHYIVEFPYEIMNEFMLTVKDMNLTLLEGNYDLDCRVEVAVRRSLSPRFGDFLRKNTKFRFRYHKSS